MCATIRVTSNYLLDVVLYQANSITAGIIMLVHHIGIIRVVYN